MKTIRTSFIAAGLITAVLVVPATASANHFERKVMKGEHFIPPGKIKPSKFHKPEAKKEGYISVPELGSEGLMGAAVLLLGSGLLLAQRRRRRAAA